ncbi:MAG TPA: TonB family protein [Puia sp.]|jgi:TonB family protein|nr:TonB family protein [Puia sp.]
MRPYNLTLFLLLIAATAFSQQRKEVTDMSGDKYRRIKEVYFVLRSDKSVRDGPYRQFRNDKLIVSGYYKNGQKDSVWEAYSNTQAITSRKWYDKGKMTGKWEFFNSNGEPTYTYDFSTGKVTWSPGSPRSDTITRFYRNDAGEWVRGRLDQDIVPLFGPAEWLSYLNANFRYPDEALNKNQQGRVVISMIVDENGQVSDYAVSTSVAPSLDSEALRVVSSHENLFAPAVKDGKKVRSVYFQPMVFRLEN